ncbi:MAG: GIY-YIG nuclease family protein [Patescibacteria group bacterium]|jgi:excinuclease ABC subunit C
MSSLRNLDNIPPLPGVYIYKNKVGEIIYVGKAVNLKKRVTQYFQKDDALGPKTKQLVAQIHDISYKIVDSEIEALILESSLIKKFRPKYNSQLKDDKSYIYICITKDKIPLVFSTHATKLPSNSNVYGPFPSGSSVKSLLKTIRKIFPYRTSSRHPSTSCLYCHLKLCPGPSPDPTEYRKNIRKIKKILTGNFVSLKKSLIKEMEESSKDQNFENAIKIRDQLAALDYVVSGWHNLNHLFEQANLPDDKTTLALNGLSTLLKKYFPRIEKINRIEAYDISNLGSKYFVGSMVVFSGSNIDINQYRKFKIYTKETQDDQYMIKEIVWRRLKHFEWTYPDIILVDGGKPQVSAANSVLELQSKKNIALIGLAKKQEIIVIKTPEKFVEVNLPRNSETLKLLQKLRDEAHRFANNYRRQLQKRHSLD